MKPRPMAPKSKRTDDPAVQPMPATPTRTIFVKDTESSRDGFTSFEEADREREALGEDTDQRRVRVRYRKRTERWDLLVKVAKQVPITERAIGE